MKIINSTEAQLQTLHYIYPEHRISPYMALVPASEYYFWARRFNHLHDALSAHLYPTSLKMASKIPVIQCVAKLIGTNAEGFLVPKVFKFGTLPEGTFKDFGFSSYVVPLLEAMAASFNYPIMRFPVREYKTSCLGFFAWDIDNPPIKVGDRNLHLFVPCVGSSRLKDIKVNNDRITFEGKDYTHFIPTNNYYENKQFQKLLIEMNEHKLLVLPLHSPLDNIQSLIGFTNPSWAEVKPLEFFLEESPENLDRYVLIRTDDGKIVTWTEVMATPKLRLEIEMSEYWLWQEACITDKSLESINMYWEFGMEYPWLIDKRDNSLVPTFIVED